MKHKIFVYGLFYILLTVFYTATATADNGMHNGVVRTTMASGGYVYAEVEETDNKFWIAAPFTEVSVGDEVTFPDESWMADFTSKTLNRTFERIMFVSFLKNNSKKQQTQNNSSDYYSNPGDSGGQFHQSESAGHGQSGNMFGGIPKSESADAPKPDSIKKVSGGYTVEELFSKKDELDGKTVKVRGKVVKVSRFIMGMNWIHIKDGTGDENSSDITFTSKTELADVGSIVVAQGTLKANKDFGAGYMYPAIVEDSTFQK